MFPNKMQLSESGLEKIPFQTRLRLCVWVKWKISTIGDYSLFPNMEVSNLIADYELPIYKEDPNH